MKWTNISSSCLPSWAATSILAPPRAGAVGSSLLHPSIRPSARITRPPFMPSAHSTSSFATRRTGFPRDANSSPGSCGRPRTIGSFANSSKTDDRLRHGRRRRNPLAAAAPALRDTAPGRRLAHRLFAKLVRPDLCTHDDDEVTADFTSENLREAITRTAKSRATDWQGRPLFKGHVAETHEVDWTEEEREVARELTRYIQQSLLVAENAGAARHSSSNW